jgi:hypothetical protein
VISLSDFAALQEPLRDPFDKPAPNLGSEQHDREVVELAGLDQRQRLEQLIEPPNPPRRP